MMNVLVIDVGSSSARALLFDQQTLEVLSAASRKYSFTTTPPGAAEVDARTLQGLVEDCLDEVLAHAAAQSVGVVGMDTFVGNVVGVNAKGQPVTPLYTYADTRSAPQVETLRSQIDVEETHQRTGCLPHTAYLPARLLWLRQQGHRSGVRWLDFGNYLYEAWFGREVPCSYSVASWNGLLNREKLAWDEEWRRLLDLPREALPDLADLDTLQTGLADAYAERWPVLRQVPFCLAIGDGAGANVGSGAVDASRIALTVGTTAAIRKVTAEAFPAVPPGLWCYRMDARHQLIGGATVEGGNIFQWVRQVVALPPEAESELPKRAPDAHGLTFLPLLAGERSPGWNARATGTVTGLRLSTTPLDVLQAALEGVALRLSLVLDQLTDGDEALAGAGGALTASPAWAQIMANAFGRPLEVLAEPEVTARGVAILALHALGASALDAYPPAIADTFQPQPDHVRALRAAREKQTWLYKRLYKGPAAEDITMPGLES
jgi:gluconokinase